jgi:hypothetical protein
MCFTENCWLSAGWVASFPFFVLACIRGWQGFRILLFKRRLVTMRSYRKRIRALPSDRQRVYVGQGFRWLSIHRQRLHLLPTHKISRYAKHDVGGKPWLHGVGAMRERLYKISCGSRVFWS